MSETPITDRLYASVCGRDSRSIPAHFYNQVHFEMSRLETNRNELLTALEWLTNIACGVGRAGKAPEHGEVEAAIEASMHAIARAKGQ